MSNSRLLFDSPTMGTGDRRGVHCHAPSKPVAWWARESIMIFARRSMVRVASLAFALAAIAVGCGGSTVAGTPGGVICEGHVLAAPVSHRVSATACGPSQPSLASCDPSAHAGCTLRGATGCSPDAGDTCGTCEASASGGSVCRFPDACLSDDDCGPSGVCSCQGMTFGFSHLSNNNQCLPSNCRVDSDCETGFCSPTVSTSCGGFYGVQGYFCHTCEDTCMNDGDCMQMGANGPVKGYCAYQPTVGHWACGFGLCAG